MYLPFVKAKGQPTLGLQPLALADWIEIDQDFETQLAYKSKLLSAQYESVFSALPGSLAAQKETLDLLIAHLLRYFPATYRLLEKGERSGKEKGVYSSRLQQAWRFSDFAAAPLELAARLVQEDFCIMLPGEKTREKTGEEGYWLAAAAVCFPLRWCLGQKLGQPLGLIHGKVPGYKGRLHRPVNSVFERLRVDFPGVRFNWSVVDSAELHLVESKHTDSKHTESMHAAELDATITAENAGEKLWLRVERQTLRRLPLSGAVLFTIRSYVYPLAAVVEREAIAQQLSEAIQALAPDMQKYKNLLPFHQALLAYLSRRIQANCLLM